MKLYHCTGARSMRAVWTLEEMGLDYELEVLPFPPRVFQKDYLALNPLGTIPFLIDGDTQMTESSGICHYLTTKYGPTDLGLGPDHPEYGAFLNWLYHSDATLTFPQTIFFRYTQLEPEERRIPQAAADYRKWFVARTRLLNQALETRDYLCANRFTIADICVGYALQFAKVLQIEEAFTPPIAAWFQRISDRPAFKAALEK